MVCIKIIFKRENKTKTGHLQWKKVKMIIIPLKIKSNNYIFLLFNLNVNLYLNESR